MPIGSTLTLTRVLPILQGVTVSNQGNFYPQVIDAALDYLTMVCQQIQLEFQRSISLPANLDASLYTMTLPVPIANTMIGWDATGKKIANFVVGGAPLPLPLGVGSGGTGGVTAPAARTNLGIDGTSRVLTAGDLAGSTQGWSMINGVLTATQNGTVLTIAIKTLAGGNPSAADPVYVLFRNVTAKTGDYTVIVLTAATSIATTVGGTFGIANNVPFRLWVVGFNDGGVFRLGVINCLTTVAGAGAGRDVTAIFALSQFAIASSTQIGAGSVAAGTFYTFGAAVASKAYSALGYLTYEAGLAAAGTFGIDQTRIDLFRTGMPLPGQVIQTVRNDTGASTNGATLVPLDDTIPQSAEGDQYMTQAITPGSAANVLGITAEGMFAHSVGNAQVFMSVYQDATANALKTVTGAQLGNTYVTLLARFKILAAGTAAATLKTRAGSNTAGTTTFNGRVAAREFGGVLGSHMEVEEIMA